jgi:hypothetical protein
MRSAVLFAWVLLAASGGELAAQAPAAPPPPATAPTIAPNEAAKAMVGTWEFTNADRDKSCTVTFRAEASAPGMKVEFDRACTGHFPFVREVVAWTLAEGDFLRLLDAKGQSVLEFSEVESGVYEAPRPGEGILFIQNAGASGPPPRTAEQMAGEWAIARGAGTAMCALTLTTTPAGDDLALRVKPPCDAFVTRFGPTTWQMDRGELVLKSARGQAWRFEEGDEETTWRRIPETADPVLMMRK